MGHTAEDILDAITTLYTTFDESFDDMYEKCSTDNQKKTLRGLFVCARDAYFKAIKESLCDNNATVDKITDDLVDTNGKINDELSDLKDVVAVINLCSQAVQLAASLATLAAAA
jgi:hypothetical protein